MNESLFSAYIAKFFPKLQRLIERVNGSRIKALTYLHKTMLNTEFAPDNKWESTTVNTTYVSADYVAVDSPLPLKARDTITSANGKLPKVGMMKVLKESDINNLNVMEAQGGNTANIAKKLAADPVACAVGIDEKNEFAFLSGLCNGYVAVKDEDNPNALMRLNFNYLAENTFGVETKGAITLDDIKNVLDKADEDGNTILHICISKTAYNALRQTDGAKELVATYQGRTFTEDSKLPVPTASIFNEAFADDNNGVDFIVIDRSIKVEIDGDRKAVKPWDDSRLIFICNDVVGTLVYGRLAEETNPVKQVEYSKVDGYKLISKYSLVNPLREVTSGQAFVAPIIEDVDQIYVLDATNADEVDEEAEASDTEDVKITYKGVAYDKEAFVTLLNSFTGGSLTATSTDANIIRKVNSLSDSQQEEFDEAVAKL